MAKESAFSFPIHDAERCEKWKQNIGKSLPNLKSCFVCEIHFEGDCHCLIAILGLFDWYVSLLLLFISDKYLSKSAKLRKRLVKNAIPTLNLHVIDNSKHVQATTPTNSTMQKKYDDLVLQFERKESVLRAVIKQKDQHIQQLKQTIDALKNDDKYNLHNKRTIPFKKRFHM